MTRKKAKYFAIFALVVAAAVVAGARGFAASHHPTQRAALGVARSAADLEAVVDEPGPVEVETVVAAAWAVPREGLVNLDHPTAAAAGLAGGPEPIHVYLHALRHPERGLFIVDSGVERALLADPGRAAARGIVAKVTGLGSLRVELDTATWLSRQSTAPAGVLLTHLHLDHILGLPDVPRGTPIFAGPGETSDRSLLNLFRRPTTDRALAGHGPIQQWRFAGDPSGRFAGVLDLFGDGSIWALHVPGHTPGSTAYLARTPSGPVLFVGDACHTAWGWRHAVEPGSFSTDQPRSRQSLASLLELVARHPGISVRLGHQELGDGTAERTAERARAQP